MIRKAVFSKLYPSDDWSKNWVSVGLSQNTFLKLWQKYFWIAILLGYTGAMALYIGILPTFEQ